VGSAAHRWIIPPRVRVDAPVRLFCLPFAGGGASAYRTWGTVLAPHVEVCPIQLPGREERFDEPAHTNLRTMASIVVEQLHAFFDKPYALFGHSMGALLSYEVLRQLEAVSAPAPVQAFLSAYVPPHRPSRWAPIHQLPDAAFLDELRQLEGTPEAVLQHPELMQFLLPTLRADFQACETYEGGALSPLATPLTIYGGTDDGDVSEEELAAWQVHTSSDFRLRIFPGNHFYLHSAREALLADISHTLQALRTPRSAPATIPRAIETAG